MSRFKQVYVPSKVLEETSAAVETLSTDIAHSSSDVSYSEVQMYLELLPAKEQDVIDLCVFKGKRQGDVATFLGITQGAVSQRLTKAKKRLKYLRDMPKLSEGYLRASLDGKLPVQDIDLIIFISRTTCQDATAKLMAAKYGYVPGLANTQIRVFHQLNRVENKLKNLCETDPTVKPSLDLLIYVKSGACMLWDVVLPHTNREYKVTYGI